MQPLIPLKVAYGTLVLPIGTIPGRVGLGRVRSGRSNSDYNVISASQQSWSFGLAELGKKLKRKTTQEPKNNAKMLFGR